MRATQSTAAPSVAAGAAGFRLRLRLGRSARKAMRRFCARPSSVSLSATGSASP